MAFVVKVVNGKIQEFENGNHRRTYGSNIVVADTDGHIVVAVTTKGRVEEFENGNHRRTYGSNAVNVQVSGGIVAVTTSKGKVEEYKMVAIKEPTRK